MTSDYNGENLVFIAGCPRSGTTWIQRLIASHPMIRTGQESFILPWYVHPIAQRWSRELRNKAPASIGLSAYLDEKQGRELIKHYVQLLFDSVAGDLKPGMLFLEKTPDNSFYIKEVVEYLPRAKMIHIIRDCRDVVSSLLAASKTWGFKPWGDLNSYSAAKLWVRHLDAVKRSRQLIPSGQFFELRYESLMERAEDVLDEIFNFLGIDWPREQISEAVRRNSLSSDMQQRTRLAVRGEKAQRINSQERITAEFGSHSTSSARRGLGIAQRLMVWMAARDTLKEYGYA